MLSRRRIRPADRVGFRRFLGEFRGKRVEAALEATTGWRFVVEELQAAGHIAHLAEPAETAGLRGPKKRAKSDRADARHLRELLQQGRLPESWIPPTHILELRSEVLLRHTPPLRGRKEERRRMGSRGYSGHDRPLATIRVARRTGPRRRCRRSA